MGLERGAELPRMPGRRTRTVRKGLGTILLAGCLGSVALGSAGCGGDTRESLTDCIEAETGYVIRQETSRLNCEEASLILGLIGSAEHGTQKIENPDGGVWMCKAFPKRAGAVKYACREGRRHFSVYAPT